MKQVIYGHLFHRSSLPGDSELFNAGEVWYFQDTSPFWDVDEERTVDDIERINAAADGDAFVLPEFISHRSGNIVVHISLEICLGFPGTQCPSQ